MLNRVGGSGNYAVIQWNLSIGDAGYHLLEPDTEILRNKYLAPQYRYRYFALSVR